MEVAVHARAFVPFRLSSLRVQAIPTSDIFKANRRSHLRPLLRFSHAPSFLQVQG